MNKTLIVNGMHCNACVSLVKMEIEEIGLADKLESITLLEGRDKGEIALKDVDQVEIDKISTVVNNLESYSVEK